MLYYEAKCHTYEGLTPDEFDCLEDIYLSNSFPNQPCFWEFFDNACNVLGCDKEWLVKRLFTSSVSRIRYEISWQGYEVLLTNLNAIKSAP